LARRTSTSGTGLYRYLVANAVGGGLDYQIFGPVSVRDSWTGFTRFFDNGQNDVRFSTGIAVHF